MILLGASLEEFVAALEEIEKEKLENSLDNSDSSADDSTIFPGREENNKDSRINSGGRNKSKGSIKGSKKGNRNKGNGRKNNVGGKGNRKNGRGKGGSRRNNDGFKNSVPLYGLYSRPN